MGLRFLSKIYIYKGKSGWTLCASLPVYNFVVYSFPQWICSSLFFSGFNFFWTSSKFLSWFYYFYQFYFFSVMTWCLYFLTKHPEVQEKVYQEIEEVLEDEDIKPMVSSELKSVTQVLFWSPSFHSQYGRTPPCGHFYLPQWSDHTFNSNNNDNNNIRVALTTEVPNLRAVLKTVQYKRLVEM